MSLSTRACEFGGARASPCRLIAGAGVVLHHNRPYGDVYMSIAEPFRARGFGTYLVQVSAARCKVNNVASRKTPQKAGFVPCGNLVTGDLANPPSVSPFRRWRIR